MRCQISNNDKEVSYCQGMNFIAGFLLIISEFNETDTFYMMQALFSDTFSDTLGIRGFYSENFPLLKAYMYIFEHYFGKKMPELKSHFAKLDMPNEVWVSKWFQTLFTICLPMKYAIRVWDFILAYGLEFIISFTIALLKNHESDLLKLEDSFDVIDYFKTIFTVPNNKDSNSNSYCNSAKKSNSPKFNFEDILTSAAKLNINKATILSVKKEYEKKFNVDLSFLNKKYDISFGSTHSNISLSSNNNTPSATISYKTHNLSDYSPTKIQSKFKDQLFYNQTIQLDGVNKKNKF